MANILDLILEGDNIGAKKLVNQKLFEFAGEQIIQKRMKVIAEMFKESPEVLDLGATAPAPVEPEKSDKLRELLDLVRTAHKFGFEHKGSEQEKFGQRHTFQNQFGHQLTIHKKKYSSPYWSHSNEAGAIIANGDDNKKLAKHFAGKYLSERNHQIENIIEKHGGNLVKVLERLNETSDKDYFWVVDHKPGPNRKTYSKHDIPNNAIKQAHDLRKKTGEHYSVVDYFGRTIGGTHPDSQPTW